MTVMCAKPVRIFVVKVTAVGDIAPLAVAIHQLDPTNDACPVFGKTGVEELVRLKGCCRKPRLKDLRQEPISWLMHILGLVRVSILNPGNFNRPRRGRGPVDRARLK